VKKQKKKMPYPGECISSNLSISQYLHPKETAMLNRNKKKKGKLKQDPVPKSLSGCHFTYSFFLVLFLLLMVQDGFVKTPGLVKHTKKDTMQRRRMKKTVL
jgi:hypothetical protein